MEVLKVKKYKVNCDNCDAVLLFNKGDVKEDWLETDAWVVCPICKKKTHIGSLCFYEIDDEEGSYGSK